MHATDREVLARPLLSLLLYLDVGRRRIFNQADRVDVVQGRVDVLGLIHVRLCALPVLWNRLDSTVLVTFIVELVIGEILHDSHVFVLLGEA